MRGLFKLAAVTCLLLATSASADYVTDFENLVGSPGGELLTGQDAWFNPVAGSVDWRVYTYAGNTPGIPQNPTGANQFAGGTSAGGAMVARAQRNEAFPNPVFGHYTFIYDFCGNAPVPATNNLGSFSIQPSSAAAPNGHMIQLFSWVPGMEGLRYRGFYMHYMADGSATVAPGSSPGAAWDNLDVRHWYQTVFIVDWGQNKIIEVRIKDLNTNVQATHMPIDWYLFGGAAGPGQQPTGYRLFTGGGAGNVMAFDNLSVRAGITTPVESRTWGGIKATFLAGGVRRAAPAPIASNPSWPAVD